VKILILASFSPRSTIHGLTEGLDECGYQWEQEDIGKPANCTTSAFTARVAKKAENCDTVMIGKGTPIPMNVYPLMIDKCPDTTFFTFDSVSGNGCGPPGRPLESGPRGMLCDRIILTGTEGARWFRQQEYTGRIAQIYQGCRHRIWKPGTYPRANQNRLCFLGGHYIGDGDRKSKFQAIWNAGYQMKPSKRTFHEEAADAYWNSAICPNFVCGDITSNRVMRILSSGGFCLTEQNADIDHSFTDGVELAKFGFGDLPQMLKQVKHYMEQPELRNEIAMRGYEWTRDKSWAHQAEKMVRFIRGEDIPADGAAGRYISYQESSDSS